MPLTPKQISHFLIREIERDNGCRDGEMGDKDSRANLLEIVLKEYMHLSKCTEEQLAWLAQGELCESLPLDKKEWRDEDIDNVRGAEFQAEFAKVIDWPGLNKSLEDIFNSDGPNLRDD